MNSVLSAEESQEVFEFFIAATQQCLEVANGGSPQVVVVEPQYESEARE